MPNKNKILFEEKIQANQKRNPCLDEIQIEKFPRNTQKHLGTVVRYIQNTRIWQLGPKTFSAQSKSEKYWKEMHPPFQKLSKNNFHRVWYFQAPKVGNDFLLNFSLKFLFMIN